MPRCAAQGVVDPNYPPPVSRPTWCEVPNYRYYRFVPSVVRGYRPNAPDDPLSCGAATGQADGCVCGAPDECRSEYCVPDPAMGVGYCLYPIVQIAEVEFWRHGQKVNTRKVPDDFHDAFRVMNGVDVSQTWGVWELEFYLDTACSNQLLGGAPIASSSRTRGFGHSIDKSAPLGAHDTPRTHWQATFQPPLERFELHGPVQYAFDGDVKTNWWPTCENPCAARSEWLGLNFSAPLADGVKCVRIIQDKDRDYASFSLAVQGHRYGGDWETFATFNAATWAYGGVWERLSVPQGVAFVTSTAHARLMDGDLLSSAVEVVGTPFTFDFGVEVEVDAWRWATAVEPSENTAEAHDGFACDRDGRCPRDPMRWTLEGSLNGTAWEVLHQQDEDYPVDVRRARFVDFLPVWHRPSLSIEDVWPDGRGRCARRR